MDEVAIFLFKMNIDTRKRGAIDATGKRTEVDHL